MPNYVSSPFKAMPQLLTPNSPAYVWGSFNDKTGPTIANVISNSAVTTVATVKLQILSGNYPVAGSLITVVGASNSPNFNVTGATIISVSSAASPDAGIVTVTYAITSTSQATLSDGGQAVIPQPEVGETVSGTGASVPVAVNAWNASGKSLSVTLTIGAGLSGITAVLEGANRDIAAEYNAIGIIGTGLGVGTTDWQSGQGDTATGTLTSGSVNFLNFKFYRLNITAVTGSGLVVAKIMD